MPKLNFELRP